MKNISGLFLFYLKRISLIFKKFLANVLPLLLRFKAFSDIMIPTVKKTIRAGSGVAVKFLVTLQPFFNPASIFFFSLVGLIIGAVYWASVVEIDEVIRANGKIVPASKAKTVQSEFQGSIEEILIDDGEKVEKNQT